MVFQAELVGESQPPRECSDDRRGSDPAQRGGEGPLCRLARVTV